MVFSHVLPGHVMNKFLFSRFIFCLILLAIVPNIAFAEEGDELATDDEFLELYFEESQVVEAATRISKPINQVAENVTIITAEEIERMNAHNIDDVLNRRSNEIIRRQPLLCQSAKYSKSCGVLRQAVL